MISDTNFKMRLCRTACCVEKSWRLARVPVLKSRAWTVERPSPGVCVTVNEMCVIPCVDPASYMYIHANFATTRLTCYQLSTTIHPLASRYST